MLEIWVGLLQSVGLIYEPDIKIERFRSAFSLCLFPKRCVSFTPF